MAVQGDTNSTTDPLGHEPGQQDLTAHERGYEKFLGYLKWGAIIAFIVAAVVVVILAR